MRNSSIEDSLLGPNRIVISSFASPENPLNVLFHTSRCATAVSRIASLDALVSDSPRAWSHILVCKSREPVECSLSYFGMRNSSIEDSLLGYSGILSDSPRAWQKDHISSARCNRKKSLKHLFKRADPHISPMPAAPSRKICPREVQEVERETEKDTRARRLQSYESSHMKLRPRPGGRALAKNSGNPDRKRKASADGLVAGPAKTRKMDKNIPTVTPRGRGRPRKDQKPSIDPEFALPLRAASVPVLGSIPTLLLSSSSASSRKPPTSPSRKRQHTLDSTNGIDRLFGVVIPDTAIDTNHLGFCDPSVHEAMSSDLQSVQQNLPSSVSMLHGRLQNVPSISVVVPLALRDAYNQEANTPRNTKAQNF
ncbi:hypothetical protein BDR22DRAFT_889384 [Usnea florida]